MGTIAFITPVRVVSPKAFLLWGTQCYSLSFFNLHVIIEILKSKAIHIFLLFILVLFLIQMENCFIVFEFNYAFIRFAVNKQSYKQVYSQYFKTYIKFFPQY